MKQSRLPKAKVAAGDGVPFAVLADEHSISTLRSRTGLLSRVWDWLQSRKSTRADSRRLRIADTVSLGEKRFVAVVQVAGRDFLVAGGPSNIALLAQLNPNEPFEDVLRTTLTVPRRQPAKRKRTVKRKQTKVKPPPKLETKPEKKLIPRQAPVMSEPQMAQFNMPGSFGKLLQKNIKPARKQPAKRQPAASASQHSDARPEPESAEAATAFNMPDAFRSVLQNKIAADGNAPGKLNHQKNGRSETEHTGHWA